MQRYRVDFGYGRYYFEPNAAGDWVKHEDAHHEIERLQHVIKNVAVWIQGFHPGPYSPEIAALLYAGTWCWLLDSVNPIGPWPWRGAQGLWDINEDELNAVANRELGIAEPAR